MIYTKKLMYFLMAIGALMAMYYSYWWYHLPLVSVCCLLIALYFIHQLLKQPLLTNRRGNVLSIEIKGKSKDVVFVPEMKEGKPFYICMLVTSA